MSLHVVVKDPLSPVGTINHPLSACKKITNHMNPYFKTEGKMEALQNSFYAILWNA